MSKIFDIKAREILDSRGNPTIETQIFLDTGLSACASVPAGASKGKHEAVELRDGDVRRFNGLGVLSAIENVEEKIKPLLVDVPVTNQQKIDRIMIETDGTVNKSSLGANAILAVSMAVVRTAALSRRIPLYNYLAQLAKNNNSFKLVTPLFNIVNGGLHGGNAKLTIQEFLAIPITGRTFSEKLKIGVEIYHALKKVIKKANFSTAIGDEGGFSPEFVSNDQAIGSIIESVKKAGYSLVKDVVLGSDMAASTYYKDGKYTDLHNVSSLVTADNYLKQVKFLSKKYNFFSLEDPLDEDDWANWVKLTKCIGGKTLIVGDDLLATNPKRLKKAIEEMACNAILIKLNQIGTVTETLDVIKQAQQAGFKIVVSHRSGETNDDFIADLAVGVGADFVKFGAPARGERVAKYNRLLKIYHELNPESQIPNLK